MDSPKLELDHCVISVSDRSRSDEFYRAVIGAEVVTAASMFTEEQFAALPAKAQQTARSFRYYRLGSTQLNVHGPELDIDAALLARVPVAPGGSDLCFEWPGSIAEAVAHLQRLNVPIESGPRPTAGRRGAGVSVYFRDPDGSLLEFISYRAEHL